MDKRRNNYDLTAEVDTGRLFNAVMHRVWIVVVSALVCAIVSFAGTKSLVTPQYQAAVMLYVNNGNISGERILANITSDSLRSARQLVDTYVVLLQSRTTLEEVIERAGVSDDVEEIRARLSVEIVETMEVNRVNDTEIFRVIIKRADPLEAERIANAIADVLPQRISQIMDKTSAKVVEAAVLPSRPSTPNLRNSLILGTLFGLVLGVGIIARRELFNDRIQTVADLKQFEKIVILAEIPELSKKN